ncbi:PilT/PilU family type 4a pilus ATPase [Dyella acidisoli]|uniref:Twitching motility protein PilT n=1 Tax=Dyella acidisoli TaxID=1867834 RepID=A0ABQ5XXE0_9GAMM|nr:PilT/PilU family type 4a pilus ATPase [Dyella acidisoli]GLQ95573.1 twitching motility protein PilT [Dyella acidisoli]
MDISDLLASMAAQRASDLYLSHGAPPLMVVAGVPRYVGDAPLTPINTHEIAYSLLSDRQQKEFESTLEMNLGIAPAGIGRFRVNVYRQRGEVAIAIRYITTEIPDLDTLRLPSRLRDLVMLPRGLVLVVGATGSGKSTTLASMLDYRNSNRGGHILTIEDPIEYLHQHRKSVIDQREVGIDTLSYANALRNAMREAPHVIMIGEIRDRETMQQAISYAETGHLCLSTLHANNANQTLDRILNFFPDTARHQLLIDLSLNLKAVVSQRLLHAVDGTRVPAVELLLGTAYISDLIEKGEIATIRDAMKQSSEVGMQTFDQALYALYAAGTISYAEAIEHADSRTDLALQVRLQGPAPKESASSVVEGVDLPLSLKLGR